MINLQNKTPSKIARYMYNNIIHVCSTVDTKILHCLMVVQSSGTCLIAVINTVVNPLSPSEEKLKLSLK